MLSIVSEDPVVIHITTGRNDPSCMKLLFAQAVKELRQKYSRKDFDFIPFNIETANNASGCMSKLELCVKSFLAFEKVST